MRIPLRVRQGPAFREARVYAHLYSPTLGVARTLDFLVDTGASGSLISERDAAILGIDYEKLELLEQPIFGIGGTAPAYRINSESKLVFRTLEGGRYLLSLPNIIVTKVAMADERVRKFVFDQTPSLLGMDAIERFRFVLTKDYGYLEHGTDGLEPGDSVVYKSEHGETIAKAPGLKEAYSRRKTAKIGFEDFEKMTDEVLGD